MFPIAGMDLRENFKKKNPTRPDHDDGENGEPQQKLLSPKRGCFWGNLSEIMWVSNADFGSTQTLGEIAKFFSKSYLKKILYRKN